MPDQDQRLQERRWRATGAVEDEAAHWGGRARAGRLPRARLDLTARAGLPAAVRATGVEPLPLDDPGWEGALAVAARDDLVRLSCALAAAALPHLPAPSTRDAVEAMLAAAGRWLAEPTPEAAETCYLSARMPLGGRLDPVEATLGRVMWALSPRATPDHVEPLHRHVADALSSCAAALPADRSERAAALAEPLRRWLLADEPGAGGAGRESSAGGDPARERP